MLKANYTHFVPEAKENPDYDKHLNYILIKDFEDLKDKLHLENEIVAWDTETSSLSPEEGGIVGFSWSIDGMTGYYCPVDHIDCKIDGAVEYFVSELRKAKLSLLYNARFDIRMVEWHLRKYRSSEDLAFMRNKFIDVMNAVWIADTNYTLPSLKWATRHFLGYQPPKFLETLGDETNFHFVKVKDAFTYAALDAINTFNVFKVCQCYHNEAGIASYLDTQASWIIGHLEETPLKLNTEKIKKIMVDVKRDLDEIENNIYKLAGEKFNIRSNRELTKIFLKLGIDTGERTKAGDMKTSKTLLGSYLEQYPDTIILKKIIDYKETFKFYNSYLKTLVEIGDNQNEKPIRFSYKLQAADTTRLSCCDKNTIIYTNHGIKKIVELNDGDEVDDGTGKFYPANLLNMGKRMLYEVKFSDGTISHLTSDHKLLTVGENGYVWKELKDIEINRDRVCVKYNNRRREETDELFYLYVVLSYKSRIVGEKKLLIESVNYGKDFYDKVTKILKKYNIQYDNAKTVMESTYRNKKTISEYKILISDYNYDKLVQLLSDNYSVDAREDVFDAFKPDINLIDSIQKAETFLECVHDVKIYKHRDSNIVCEFISANQDILKDIKIVLSFIGISSEPIRPVLEKYKKRKDMEGKYLFNTTSVIFYKYMFGSNYRGGYYYLPNVPQFIEKYILNHPIINYKLWRNEIGRRVLTRFAVSPNFNYCMNFNEEFELGLDIFYYITINSIREYKIDDTYTLSVESDKHRYMSDSFISHNCGKDGKNPFFSKLNLQSIPKPKSCKSYGRAATKEEIENKEDLLGWVFSPDHPEWSPGVCVEGMSLNKNVRDAFIPENGSEDYLVSIDMSAEEARIVTNLFREQYFADIINNGGDIHHENSNRIFGAENYTKETRKKSKQALFGMLYGQGERGFQQKFPYMTIEEVRDFLDTFKSLIPNIVRGQARMTREARKTGTFKTTFGHSIRIKSYLTSSNYKDKTFGERKIKNCYSPDTEFLTLEGWKYAKEITPITQIAYYDPGINSIRFTSAGKRLTNICTESVKCESRIASWNVTKNHNMWIRDSRNDNWRFVEAEKLVNKKVFEERASCMGLCEDLLETDKVETPIGKYNRCDLAKLFGWLITSSNINRLNHIIITLTEEESFSEVIDTVKKFNGITAIKNKSLYKSGKILYARICGNEFVRWCIEQMDGKLKKDRNIPKFILNSAINVRDTFIRSVTNGDGNKRDDQNSFCVQHCSRKFVNAFQSLLTYSGYGSSHEEYKDEKGQSLYSISITKSDFKPIGARTSRHGRSNISIVKHEPTEFSCFNVPTHILITRHNGKVSFHGNSPIQGCAAEVLKLEFVRLWDNVFTKYPEIKFHSTIHDEINFSVPRRLANEVIPIMIKCMTVKMENWLVPLDCSLSVGYTMGTLIPFKYNFETKEFIPDWEELVKKDTEEAQEDEAEIGEYMDDMEDGYENSDFDI